MGKQQSSKRARKHRKQARHAAQPEWMAHPSHLHIAPILRKRKAHGARTLADVQPPDD